MSTKIIKKLKDREDKIELTNSEFNFMNSLDTVDRSFKYYLEELKKEFLHTIAIRNGYKMEDQVELTIDLKSEDHILIIKKLK